MHPSVRHEIFGIALYTAVSPREPVSLPPDVVRNVIAAEKARPKSGQVTVSRTTPAVADVGSRGRAGAARAAPDRHGARRLLLRSTQSLAARHEREHKRAAAAVFPERHGPDCTHHRGSRGRGPCAQYATTEDTPLAKALSSRCPATPSLLDVPAQPLQHPRIRRRVIIQLRRLDHLRHRREPRIVHDPPEGDLPERALGDELVPVLA